MIVTVGIEPGGGIPPLEEAQPVLSNMYQGAMQMGKWLVKTEPDKYSIDDLKRDGTTRWDGVRNALAQQHLRRMEPGDIVMVYHSQVGKSIVGLAEVSRRAYLDPTDKEGRSVCVDLKYHSALEKPITLTEIKADERLKELALVRMSRLSVMPVVDAHWKILSKMAGIKA